MKSLVRQWRALSVHDRYALVMLGIMFVIPGIALLVAMITVIIGTFTGLVTWRF